MLLKNTSDSREQDSTRIGACGDLTCCVGKDLFIQLFSALRFCEST